MVSDKGKEFRRVMGDRRPIVRYCAIHVELPPLAYFLIFHTLHVEADDQEPVMGVLGLVGLGAFIWAQGRWK